MSTFSNPRFRALVGIVLAAAIVRLIPHWPNFTPIGALALFGGAHFASKRAALAVPLAAMLLSDCVYQLLFGWGFHSHLLVVYGCFAAVVCLGFMLRTRRRVLPVASATVVAAAFFFLVTNFSVWTSGWFYPLTWEGLMACYAAGLPYFGNALAGDAFYTAVLFGGFALAEGRFPVLRAETDLSLAHAPAVA